MGHRATAQSILAHRPRGTAMVNLLVATWVCFSMRPADSEAPGFGVASTWRGGPSNLRGPLDSESNGISLGQVRATAGRMSRGQFAQRITLRGGDGEEEEPQAATQRLQKAAAERMEARQAAADKAWADGGGKYIVELPPLDRDLPPLEGEEGERPPMEDFIWSKEFGETFNPLFMTGMSEEEVRVINPQPSTHPGGNPGANLKSTSHRCHPILVAFVWQLTKETINLPLG